MSVSAISAALKLRLETVPNVGVVNDWEPYVVREEDLKRYFKSPSLSYLLGWSITRESTQEAFHAMGKSKDGHQFVIRGYRAVDNEAFTEKAFQDLVETVRDALHLEYRGKFGNTVIEVTPPQVRLMEPRMFGSVFVHYVEIALMIGEVSAW